MGKSHQTAVFLGACLLGATSLNGGERLTMRASPTVAYAPGYLRVSATVEADDENRSLLIVAESEDFYGSSQIPLDGRNARRLNVFEFRGLPTGMYQVTGVLVGTHGQRAVTQVVARVQPSLSSQR